jgi:hypothetical protein
MFVRYNNLEAGVLFDSRMIEDTDVNKFNYASWCHMMKEDTIKVIQDEK